MKRVFGISVMAVLLVLGLTAQSMALFEVGSLTVSLYNSEDADVGFDPGIDLATLAAGTPVEVVVNRNGFSGSVGWADISAGAYGYSGPEDDHVFFATTDPAPPAVVDGSWNACRGADDGVKNYYNGLGTNPAVGLASDFGSYWVKMDSATTPGQYAGLNANPLIGEANLADIESDDVIMYLYKFERLPDRSVALVGGGPWSEITLTLTATVEEPPVIEPIDDESACVGVTYTGPTPTLSQGAEPITWSLVQGPAGMVIDPDTGVVSLETPELGGPYTVEIRADNAFGSDTEDWALTVTECTGPCAATPASTLGTTSTPKSIPFGFLALVPMAALAVLRVRKRIV